MHQKVLKVRCTKQSLRKSDEVVRTYSTIQTALATILDKDSSVVSIKANVPFDGDELNDYVSDFVCQKKDGELMVRECVFRKQLTYPKACKELDLSRNYWLRRGVTDWAKIDNSFDPIEESVVEITDKIQELSHLLKKLSDECEKFNHDAIDTQPIQQRLHEINDNIAYYDVIELSGQHDTQKNAMDAAKNELDCAIIPKRKN